MARQNGGVSNIGILIFAVIVMNAGCGVAPVPGESAPVASRDSSSPTTSPSKPTPERPKIDAVTGEQVQALRSTRLVVTGGIGLLDAGLFTLSSVAKEDLPRRVGDFRMQYLEVVPLAQRGRVAVIARERYGSESHSVQLINFVSGQEYTLYRGRQPMTGLVSSPEGKWLAVAEGRGSNSRIRMINVESEEQYEIGSNGSSSAEPIFSGGKLFFETYSEDRSRIFMSALTEQGPAAPELFLEGDVGQTIRFLRFSPNESSYVLVLGSKGGESQLILKRENADSVTVAKGRDNAFEPAWSPDGTKLLFWISTRDGQGMRIYDIATAKTEVVSSFVPPRESGAFVCPAWSPDMSEVYFAANAGYWDQIFKTTLTEKKTTLMTDANLARSYSCPKVMPEFAEEEL